jgi:hypothetical protein
MKITFELDDNNVIAEALDTMVVSHLRSSKNSILRWASNHPDDVANDAEIVAAMDVLLKYYTGIDEENANDD